MSFKIVVLPSANADIKSAEKWYETQQEGLGKKFKLQIIKALTQLLNRSEAMALFI
jgi:RecA/RadA recombinase